MKLGHAGRSYCSITWNDILRWEEKLQSPTILELIALPIFSLAFTTVRRVGSFLPANKKQAVDFAWILPRFVRWATNDTMLIWLPICKSGREGSGTVSLSPTV